MTSHRRTRRFAIVAGAAAACLLAISPAAHAGARAWSDGYGNVGHGEIVFDRKEIVVCDSRNDTDRVGVEYEVAYGPFRRTALLQAGPRRGCKIDNVLLGTITSAKFCYGGDVSSGPGSYRHCNNTARF